MGHSSDEARHERPATPVSHLAILVVYFLRGDDDLPLLDLHLERIARHTEVPYTLYAVANRVSDQARDTIRSQPNVVLCDVPVTELRGSREHAHYLDAMVTRALADGASHVATLDVDSFPIDDRWIEVFTAATPAGSGIAGILRTENGDVALPHPSCIVARRDFFERFEPSFSPDSDFTPEFRRFLRATGQAGDTGIRLGYTLWSAGLPWGRVERTNEVEIHYLIAGIYGDVVFHLGAAVRDTLFRKDLEGSLAHRLSNPIERYPARRAATVRLKKSVLRLVRSRNERRIIQRNEAVSALARSWLLTDPDGLFAYLRGEAPASQAPDWVSRLAAIDDSAWR